ncbi:MAG TPA: hypothetical protein VFP94_06730, partial [Terriglobales bacterium]|nr:hypothetical protein [Terriglobales bacterium]
MRRWILAGIGVVIAAAVVWSWWAMPPSIIRSLPPGQTLIYVSWKPLRQVGALSGAVARSPGYEAFVRESGFDFQQDLDAIAISMTGPPTRPTHTTAILRGQFGPKFTAYLQRHALRRERIGGAEAFIFPGWARPQQRLSVVPLGPGELLVTNAGNAAAVVAQARRWWSAAPELWKAGNNWRMLAGYADINTEQLEAVRALDGTAPPWQGVEQMEMSLRGSDGGLRLEGTARAASPEAAAAVQTWVETELNAL